ncbi:MAG TPA: TetR family transcriptional regulator [Sphingomonadaceae bacterium]|nr:TetR family transcriptional regulator [Sphingomonadaceae bacterium]
MQRENGPKLDRARLVAAAFAVIEDKGLDGLSMRNVAARLGVQAPAIYWHISDKAELLGLMAREIYGGAYDSIPRTGSWQQWLIRFGRALRQAFASRRDGARLCALAQPSPQADPARRAERIAAPLVALGLDRRTAVSRQAAVIAYTLGWAMYEANGPMREYLDEMMIFEDSFQAGLAALVDGFARSDAAGGA